MDRFVVLGKYCENAVKKREPFRNEHLSRLSLLKEQGILITLGPTKCTSYVFGIFEAETIDQVKMLIEDDIYTKKKIWTSIEVYPWVQAF